MPEARIDAVAALVGAEPGVNHSYLREDAWNLWFVATAPDAAGAGGHARADRRAATGLEVLDLPLLRAFNIDLGFRLNGAPRGCGDRTRRPTGRPARRRPAVAAGDGRGLPLVPRPFAALARRLGWTEARVVDRHRCAVGGAAS